MQASQALQGASLSDRQTRLGEGGLTYGVFCLSYTYLSSTCWYTRQSPAVFLANGSEHVSATHYTAHSPTEYSFILSLTSLLTVKTNRIAR